MNRLHPFSFFFFFNDTATTEIYTLSLHDALPISCASGSGRGASRSASCSHPARSQRPCSLGSTCIASAQLFRSATTRSIRSEEHTSELQSQSNLVCRLLLEKKKKR